MIPDVGYENTIGNFARYDGILWPLRVFHKNELTQVPTKFLCYWFDLETTLESYTSKK